MDKSTCQSNNRQVGIFGYPEVLTKDVALLLEEIAADYGDFIGVVVQSSHRYHCSFYYTLYFLQ